MKCPALKVQRQGRQRTAVFQPDYVSVLKTGRVQSRKTLRQRISDDCRVILSRAPGKQLLLQDLIRQLRELSKDYAATSYHTFHSYITHLSFIQSIQEPTTRKLFIKLKDPIYTELAAKAETIESESIRAEIILALDLLNVEHVDSGLFRLSREFEVIIRKFVQVGASAAIFSRPVPSDTRLFKLIDFVAEERIVADQSALDYLRITRNGRVHGAVPSVEERQILMNHVVHDAGLYIDYIKFFDDKIHELALGAQN